MTDIETILSDYETGAITKRERVVALARLITPETVEATFASIPEGIAQELLGWARAAPLDGGLMIGGELSRSVVDKFSLMSHDHTGVGDPHAHDWDWTKVPPRQPPRALIPGE